MANCRANLAPTPTKERKYRKYREAVCLGMSERRFPPPWTLEKIPGGLKVCDANGQSLAYVYSRENPHDAHMAKVLTEDEARGIASNVAKLPTLLGKGE